MENYQALRDSAPCLSRAATLPKATKLELGRGARLKTPSSANHTAAASQPTGRIAKAASWLHLSRVSPALHPPERPSHADPPKPGFGGRGHECGVTIGCEGASVIYIGGWGAPWSLRGGLHGGSVGPSHSAGQISIGICQSKYLNSVGMCQSKSLNSIGMYQSIFFFFTKHLPIKAMRRQSSKFTKDHTTQHTRRRMRPSGGRPSGGEDQNRTLGARSGPPVGHRQPRPPDVGAPQNPKFNRHVVYTHRNPLLPTEILYYFLEVHEGCATGWRSEPSLAIHTPPSSDTLIRQLCRSKPATIVGLCVA